MKTTIGKKRKQTREGIVISDRMDKTVVVEVSRLLSHAKYKKVIRKKEKYAVHDDKNEAKNGNKVEIIQTRPLSKQKRWRVVKVIAA